jgi:hypothetical protein
MAHEVKLEVEFQLCCVMLGCIIYNGLYNFLYLLFQDLVIGICCTIFDNKIEGFSLRLYEVMGSFDDSFKDMHLSTLISSNFVHPEIDDEDISNR